MVTLPGTRKNNGIGKYDVVKKTSVPDYTDVAYREAVSRLRYLLNESYDHPKYHAVTAKPEESDEESGVSIVVSDRTRTARLSPFRRQPLPQRPSNILKPYSYVDVDTMNSGPPPPELMSFIERQEEYIDQLEKESQYCRDELSQLLGKVKDLIAENEALHEQQKTGVIKSVFEGVGVGAAGAAGAAVAAGGTGEMESSDKFRKRLEGPLIVFESRISELEAQLTQTKIDLRKAQDEAEMYKKRLNEANPAGASSEFFKQIENLQREKRELHESLSKLQATIVQIREKEMDASKKVQRTLDVVDKTQFEKQQAELEVNRLKSELEHQHDKLLEVISEQTRKLAEERGQAERRYLQHVEQLNNELTNQRDANSKLQLELERHLRVEEDLRRDLSAKNMTIENVKKELNSKIASLQNDLSTALAERDSIEQELNTSRLSGERTERLNRQETSRLQIEISSLRQRLDRTDAELMHSRRENLRLLEQISTQEKEITLLKIKVGEGKDGLKEPSPLENEINSRISEIESKHVETVTELEGLIENQSQVMAQLKAECESLTQKLEDSTARHKLENWQLRTRNDILMDHLENVGAVCSEMFTFERVVFGNRTESKVIRMLQMYPKQKQMSREEMAHLQNNLDYLTSKLESTLSNQQWSSANESPKILTQDNQYQSPPDATANRKEEMRPYEQSQEEYENPIAEQTEPEPKSEDYSLQAPPPDVNYGTPNEYSYQSENYPPNEYDPQQSYQNESNVYGNYQEESYPQYDPPPEPEPEPQPPPMEVSKPAPRTKSSTPARSLRSVAQARMQQKSPQVRSK